jgi:hypothetical protein
MEKIFAQRSGTGKECSKPAPAGGFCSLSPAIGRRGFFRFLAPFVQESD